MNDWIAHRDHKYIKREMINGKWRYWYKLPSKRTQKFANNLKNEIPVEKTNWAELERVEHESEKPKTKNSTKANPKELSGRYRRGEQFVEKRLLMENINNKVAELLSSFKKKMKR